MAVRTWLSTSDDLTGTVAGTGLAWSGDTVPIAGDYVRFPKEASRDIVRNRNGLAGVALAGWYVEDGCPIPFGSSGSPIHIDADEIVWFGDGPAYVQHTGTGGTNSLIYAPVSDEATMYISGNTILTNLLVSGNIDISTAGSSTGSLLMCRNPIGRGPKVKVSSSVTLGGVTLQAGEIEDSSTGTITKIINMGGQYNKIGTGQVSAYWGMNGYLNYRSTGTMGLAVLMRGTLDLSQGIEDRAVTTVRVHPNAKYLVDYNLVTITNEYILADLVGLGPLP